MIDQVIRVFMISLWTKKGLKINKASIRINELNKIRSELMVRPFQYNQLSGTEEDPSFLVYEEDDDWIMVPRFWAIDKFSLKYTPPDEDTLVPDALWEFKGGLREIQETIMSKLWPEFLNQGGGVLSVPCGYGKTCMAINIITRLRLKTLVVVHKTQLVNQWKESLQKFTDLPVGIIQQNKVDIGEDKPVVIGMLQSLSMREYEEEVLQCFDLLIVDEVHNVATKTFSKMLLKMCPRYTLGLSATPSRPDGTSKVFHWFLGPMLYRLTAKAASTTNPRKVRVEIVPYKDNNVYRFREIRNKQGQTLLPIMLSNIADLPGRNALITRKMLELLPERCILVLSSRISQLEDLCKRLNDALQGSVVVSMFVGSMKEKDQRTALLEAQVLLATYEMANEGFDLPRLNTLLFATPRSRVEQAVGRILRKEHDPQPLIIDVVDELPSFRAQGIKRQQFYKSLGYEIATL